MIEMRLQKVGLSLLLIGGLAAFAGCSGDDDPNENKDATTGTTGDSGPDTTDTGVTDTGGMMGMDAGDSGVRPDADAGNMTACPQGQEGCPCDPAGMCSDMELTCVSWPRASAMDPEIRTCVRQCDDDTQCAGSSIGTSCSDFFLNQDVAGAPLGVGGICVAQQAPLGNECKGSRRGNTMVRGCEDGLTCLTNQVGGDVGTCAQTCIVSTSTPTGGCEGATP